jgi:hypothetical protein
MKNAAAGPHTGCQPPGRSGDEEVADQRELDQSGKGRWDAWRRMEQE